MNNAKMWLVVNPTVGIPLFLTGVAAGSFAVHLAVVTNTDWVGSFLQGDGINPGASAALDTDETMKTANAGTVLEGDRLKVVLPDGSTAWAVIEAPETTLAAAKTY